MHREYKEQVFELIVALLILPLLCLILLSGCGTQPDYTTRHGIQVYDQTTEQATDRADIEYITEKALELRPTKIPWLVLRLVDEPIDLSLYYNGDCKTASGTFAEGTLTVWVRQDPCFARTAFGHELMHALHWLHDGTHYGTHEELREFNQALRAATVPEMCP